MLKLHCILANQFYIHGKHSNWSQCINILCIIFLESLWQYLIWHLKNVFVFLFKLAFPVAQMVKNLPAKQETRVQSLGQGRSPREVNDYPL